MPLNKLALLRYKTIDECLNNPYRKWTLDDLIEKVSEALYEFEGIQEGVSKRTIQADLQLMRSDKLGYNAPIIVVDKKYYCYEDKNYSITKVPINSADMEKFKSAVQMLKQFSVFNHFDDLQATILRLEGNLQKNTKGTKPLIQFENNNLLKGIQLIQPLYEAILQQKTLLINYQSFKAHSAQQNICYPYLLKEYRNRWFLIGQKKAHQSLSTFALDRIIGIEKLVSEPFLPYQGIDFEVYFSDLIGVTKSEKDKAQKVVLEVDNIISPYIITKPLHQSQIILAQNEKTTTFSIEVILNLELEREILGFAENVRVIEPQTLKKRIERRLDKAKKQYENPQSFIR
ncbi:MAG: WYL domain-containing protein [Cytophagales bacterium]|nr:MAG: WYL domain-containing protein [Cytophagales bacterium]